MRVQLKDDSHTPEPASCAGHACELYASEKMEQPSLCSKDFADRDQHACLLDNHLLSIPWHSYASVRTPPVGKGGEFLV